MPSHNQSCIVVAVENSHSPVAIIRTHSLLHEPDEARKQSKKAPNHGHQQPMQNNTMCRYV